MAKDFRGLSTEYASFDLLWFDIETKTRHLIEELIDPMVENLLKQKEQIENSNTRTKRAEKMVNDLKDTFYNQQGNMDIFDRIDVKIATAMAEIKIVEDKFLHDRD